MIWKFIIAALSCAGFFVMGASIALDATAHKAQEAEVEAYECESARAGDLATGERYFNQCLAQLEKSSVVESECMRFLRRCEGTK